MYKIVSYSHIAFHAHDVDQLVSFYCEKLGMKKKFVLTTDSMIEYSEYQASHGIPITERDQHFIDFAKANPGLQMITYLEFADHQFLELFHIREPLKEPGLLSEQYGYQHLALEVENIRDAYEEMIRRGVEPDTEIDRGPDYTYQFWIHDPEGNRIEFMEYTPESLQMQLSKEI